MKNIGKEIIISLGVSSVENLEFVCERREGGIIFFDAEKNIYIRFGLKDDIKKEFEIQKKFIDYSFV